MGHTGSSQTEQTQLDASHFQKPALRFIDDIQVVYLILASPEALQDSHVLDQPPNRKDRDGKGDGSAEKVGKLGEREVDGRLVERLYEWASAG